VSILIFPNGFPYICLITRQSLISQLLVLSDWSVLHTLICVLYTSVINQTHKAAVLV